MIVENLYLEDINTPERLHSWELCYFTDLFIRRRYFNWGVIGITKYTVEGFLDNNGNFDLSKLHDVYDRIVTRAPKYACYIKKVPYVKGCWWVGKSQFNVADHVMLSKVSDNSDESIKIQASHMSMENFEVDKPYWEVRVIYNKGDKYFTTISKIHHGLIQQYPMALAELFNSERNDKGDIEFDKIQEVSDKVLISKELEYKLKTVFGLIPLFSAMVKSFFYEKITLKGRLTATLSLWKVIFSLYLNFTNNIDSGYINHERRIDFLAISRSGIKKYAGLCGVTFNDVYVALISWGFRRLLLNRYSEEQLEKLNVAVALPVTSTEKSWGVAALVVKLPVSKKTLREHVQHIHEQTEKRKRERQDIGISMLGPSSFVLGFIQGPFKVSSAIISNIPGIDGDLFLAGSQSRVESMTPVGAVTPGQPLVIGMISKDDHSRIGFNFDKTLYPDYEYMLEGVKEAVMMITPEDNELEAEFNIADVMPHINNKQLIESEWKRV